ncbi:MAG: hypothetical protein M3177_06605 [Pseudomonadota bacterium]|nr:hypothetical protein [Pseudomonadota bacterium]
MRLYSTPGSIADGNITLLAVFETFASVAIYGVIAHWTSSFVHFAAAVCAAPLFLLRTKYSYRLGIILWDKYLAFPNNAPFLTLVRILIVPLAGPIIRFLATFAGVVKYPLRAARAMPANWFRQCLCTDLFYQPELVPGESNLKYTRMGFRILVRDAWEELKKRDSLIAKMFTVSILITTLVIGYIPALLLRISFKATSIIYIPLIFVAHTTVGSKTSLSTRLARIVSGELEKSRRWISWTILAVATLKVLALFELIEISTLADHVLGTAIAQRVLASGSWPWWQVALIADALITLFLLFFADAALGRIAGKEPWPEGRTRGVLSALTFTRGFLASTTVIVAVGSAAVLLMERQG